MSRKLATIELTQIPGATVRGGNLNIMTEHAPAANAKVLSIRSTVHVDFEGVAMRLRRTWTPRRL